MRLSAWTFAAMMAALAVAGPTSAQQSGPIDLSDSLPPDFRGTITYRGSHGALLDRGPRRGTRQYGGSLTIELTFEGNRVTGRFSGTGGINSGTMTGTRNGNHCRLIEARDGDVIEGECTRSRLSARARSTRANAMTASFEAQATRVVDSAVAGRQEPPRQTAGAAPPPRAAAATRGRGAPAWTGRRSLADPPSPTLVAPPIGASPPPRNRGQGQSAAPVEVTDRWVGRNPRETLAGGNFFWAVDSTLTLVESQDTPVGGPRPQPISWGNVIRSTWRDTSSARRQVRPVYLLPFCRGQECDDPNRGATRLLVYYENSPYLSRQQYSGLYLVAYRAGSSVCGFQANGQTEWPTAKCYFVNRPPRVITPANAAQEFERVRDDLASANEEAFQRHLSRVGNFCPPRVTWPAHSTSGVLEWGC
jgi:hypothetical protein